MLDQIDGRTAAFEDAFREVREALEKASERPCEVEIRGSYLGAPDEGWAFSAYFSRDGDESSASGHGATFTEAASAFVKDLGRFMPDEDPLSVEALERRVKSWNATRPEGPVHVEPTHWAEKTEQADG